ncbi:MAG: hypothetical protein KME26_00200 [Oscillatoria princeps RMCB-10]|nr:hypothetical protein [Oscillatoria princeps RMCB-10]
MSIKQVNKPGFFKKPGLWHLGARKQKEASPPQRTQRNSELPHSLTAHLWLPSLSAGGTLSLTPPQVTPLR